MGRETTSPTKRHVFLQPAHHTSPGSTFPTGRTHVPPHSSSRSRAAASPRPSERPPRRAPAPPAPSPGRQPRPARRPRAPASAPRGHPGACALSSRRPPRGPPATPAPGRPRPPRLPWWAPHRQAGEPGPAAPWPGGRPRGAELGCRGLSWRKRRLPSHRRHCPGRNR